MPQDGPVESHRTAVRADLAPQGVPDAPSVARHGVPEASGAPRTPAGPGRARRGFLRDDQALAAGTPDRPGPAWRSCLRDDRALAVVFATSAVIVALLCDARGGPGVFGWVLLLAAHVPAAFRTRAPLCSFLGVVAFVAPYHALDYHHAATGPVTYLALYTVAVLGTPRRTVYVGLGTVGLSVSIMIRVSPHKALELLQISGWVVAVLVVGEYVRVHRRNVRAATERAERAERTREEEARRRVAEERLRIARDLHDLLAHTITLVGVQTSVAAHVLAADPERLDRAAVARALDDIADTCRTARGELRATLEVLRADAPGEPRGPLPGVGGLVHLAESARATGAAVTLTVRGALGTEPPPAVGAAVYRIVQEALTNAVRHAGTGVAVAVTVRAANGALEVLVTDDGAPGPDPARRPLTAPAGGPVRTAAPCPDTLTAPQHPPDRAAFPAGPEAAPGFGLIGMRERARSVGGTLQAGPSADGGFAVAAVLPLSPAFPGGPAAPGPAPAAPEGERGRPWQGLWCPGETPG
ncbi:sensor histidine kinase [Streptomyces uncialis]|uniref:sensor histidine kinase n=1 Tax=Streptomyces uncialis TaxID=1048205 RepID=UPI003401986B